MDSRRRPALGRGLAGLLEGLDLSDGLNPGAPQAPKERTHTLELSKIRANPSQPRRRFERLEELCESIKKQGVLQPILVRPVEDGNYEIIAGERRFRASKALGLLEIPAIVREDLSEKDCMFVALMENLQRDDLGPLEEAEAYALIVKKAGLTHEALAEALGVSRGHVTNLIRLTGLDEEVKKWVDERLLEVSAARALLTLPLEEQRFWGRRIIDRQMSVREVEEALRVGLEEVGAESTAPSEEAGPPKAAEILEREKLRSALKKSLGYPVHVSFDRSHPDRGSLRVPFSSPEDLRLLEEALRRYRPSAS